MCDPCCAPCGSCGPCGPCSPCDPCCAPVEPIGCCGRELRGGVMYSTCDCIKRNGLQDKCPRFVCLRKRCCSSSFPSSSGCRGCDMPTACCGPHNPPCGAPCPVPYSPSPLCCPPLPEGGIPDPRIWNACNTPATYPCGF